MIFQADWPREDGLYWALDQSCSDEYRERQIEPVYLRDADCPCPADPIVEMIGTDVRGFVEDFLWGDRIEAPKAEGIVL